MAYHDLYFWIPLHILASLFNVMVIVVFSKDRMKSAVQSIFLWIGILDLAFNLTQLIKWTPWLTSYKLILMCIEFYIRFASLWFECLLAVVRYVAVAHPLKCSDWCRRERIHYGMAGCFLVTFISMIPIGHFYYYYDYSLISYGKVPPLSFVVAFVCFLSSLLMPCLVSLIFSFGLASAAYKNKRQRIGRQETQQSRIQNKRSARSTTVILCLAALIAFCSLYPIAYYLRYYFCYTNYLYFYLVTDILMHLFSYHPSIAHMKYCSIGVSECVLYISFAFPYFNVCVKFFIYYILNEQFRDATNDLISPLFSLFSLLFRSLFKRFRRISSLFRAKDNYVVTPV